MFGGSVEPPKCKRRSKPPKMTYDILLPTLAPGVYGHLGREPDTNCPVRQLEYRQRVQGAETQFLANERKRLDQEKTASIYDRHAEKKVFQRRIQERYKEKIKAYENSIEERRNKLKILFAEEEKQFIQDTIFEAQQGVCSKLEEMKKKAELLKAEREAERLKIANERRIMQLIRDTVDLRPVLEKRNLVDSKNAQLQQMKENEMRKEAEKEIESMWYDLMVKENEAKIEREVQDELKRKQDMRETVDTWEKQLQGKNLLKQEEERVAAEDHVEMLKLQEQLRREQIEALDAKRRKRDETAKILMEQLVQHEHFLAQRKKEEDQLDAFFSRLAQAEIEKEKQKVKDISAQAKRENAIYRQHLKELEIERKKEKEELEKLLEEHRKMIEKKQEEAYCKLKHARQALHESVLAGRAEQLEYKRQEAENQLKLKEAENELLRMACETNERLQAESDRLQAEEVRLYREDLKKQIESNNEKRRREKEELERELAEGLAEEERQRNLLQQLIKTRLEDQSYKHPFRRVLERTPCTCADTQ